jgi:hypothetical protein
MTGKELYDAVRPSDSPGWRELPPGNKAYWSKRSIRLSRRGIKVTEVKTNA